MSDNTTQPAPQGQLNQGKKSASFVRILQDNISLVALVVVIVFFSVSADGFLSLANFWNIGRQTAVITIIATGMTMVIISAQIDLSVGSTLALGAMLTSIALQATNSVIIGVLVGLITGLVVGLMIGIFVTKGGIPAFLASLGMMGVIRGVAMLVTHTRPVVIYNETYWRLFGDGVFFGFLPSAIFWTIIILVITHVILKYTSLGRYFYATGGNRQAARFTGVKTDLTIIIAYIMAGIMASFAGILQSSRMHAARPNIGEGMELNVIAAVILGGTSLFGGKGTIVGSLLGALVIGSLNNGLIILGFSTHVQMLVRGLVIIFAVMFAASDED
ncbi:MAG: ABC transporter permease [Spirochaetales bacterium]|nr:ABC transporter permease [Spirochaetales bacterium]MCF7938708.1 ABC transporter permease [Spirochaetales bacterium]